MQWFMLKIHYVLGLSCSIMIFSMIYYLASLKHSALITTGDCILIITICIAVVDDIWDLTQEFGDMFEEVGSFNQSISLIKPYIVKETTDTKNLEIKSGEIAFCNVTFSHLSNQKSLFQDQSIMIKGRQKVGLVGFSGSGKTTFISLIARIHDVTSGAILIDGQDIRSVTQESLRNNIIMIPQEPILFNRTVMENIRYGRIDATDSEVVNSAKLAHIHDVINSLPDGYDTICGERGNNLSGGQRQRIVIARAILKNAPILVLDEATSGLDSHTEDLIQESLSLLMKDRTVLTIAHRLSTILSMDRILVFDKGKIVGDGTHKELLKTNTAYQILWNSQVSGFIL